ncbi:MAG TPA: GDSL-type esterase/lipase family protein [Candidatus Solibacter sp.]|nr:GDSL-type esterase/lipase family protein [Candidatus Solibacter sp.]
MRLEFLLLAAASATVSAVGAQACASPNWVAAWAAPVVAGTSGSGPTNATVRNLTRLQLGGSQIRIRLSNAADTSVPLDVGAAFVAVASDGQTPALVSGTSRRVTFGGHNGTRLAPGTQYVYSDPVDFPVTSQEDIAISLFLPAPTEPTASATNYAPSWQTGNGAGDATTDEGGTPFSSSQQLDTYAVTAVDVISAPGDGAVVAFGSSTFEGSQAIPGQHGRVEDLLGARGVTLAAGHRRSVISAGIGGDTLHEGLKRIDRDAFSQSGVVGIILYDINLCLSNSLQTVSCNYDPAQVLTLAQIQADYNAVVKEAHRRGVTVLCSTWGPDSSTLPNEPERAALNQWILQSHVCDDSVDWDAVLRAPGPAGTYTFNPLYFADSIHPNPLGHMAMAAAVPNRWFTETVGNQACPASASAVSGAALPNTSAGWPLAALAGLAVLGLLSLLGCLGRFSRSK